MSYYCCINVDRNIDYNFIMYDEKRWNVELKSIIAIPTKIAIEIQENFKNIDYLEIQGDYNRRKIIDKRQLKYIGGRFDGLSIKCGKMLDKDYPNGEPCIQESIKIIYK